MFTYSPKPQTINEIWESSWYLYKASFIKLWYGCLLYVILGIGHQFLLNQFIQSILTSGKYYLIVIDYLIWLAIVACFFIFFSLRINNIATANAALSDKAILRLVKAKFINGFLMHILFILLLGADMLLTLTSFSFMSVLSLIIMLPGIFLMVCFPFMLLNMILNKTSIINACKHGIQLIWGNWWQVFLTFLLPVIAISAIAFICFLVTGVVAKLAGASQHTGLIIINLVLMIIMTFIMPYLLSLNLIIYNNLKLKSKQTNNDDLPSSKNSDENNKTIIV